MTLRVLPRLAPGRDLSFNNFTEIPEVIFSFSNLQYLYVDHTDCANAEIVALIYVLLTHWSLRNAIPAT